MIKIAMSPAASALLRALIGRAGVARDRILLTELQSTDWRSLTFTGERHQIHLRVPGPDAREIVDRMCRNLENAEFSIPGHFVADIAILGTPTRALDGSISLTVEALTIAAD
jgi:hypothetical protein